MSSPRTRTAGFRTVCAQELAFTLKRPMLWSLVAVVVLLAWGMSTGHVGLGTGSATVGGMKAWITSELSNSFIFSIMAATFYSFFLAIAAADAVERDYELKVAELIRSTPLSPGAYAWGKAAGLGLAFGLVLALHLGATMVFNHLIPNPEAELIRGPFELLDYLRPALLFALPTLIFFGGVSFYFGVRWRRPAVAFLIPLAVLTLSFSLLWNWSPPGLDPTLDRLLQLLDPAGFRWLNETWLRLDRGAEIYNTAPISPDLILILNRLLALGLGLGGIAGASRLLGRDRAQQGGKARGRARGRARGTEATSRPLLAEPLPAMRRRAASLPRAILTVTRQELGALLRHPGVYLFSVFILLQALSVSLLQRGAFNTRLLLTPGQLAVRSYNTLALMLCLLVMLFLAEALEREKRDRSEGLIYSSPVSSGALVAGKLLGISVLATLILCVTYLGGAIALLIQGSSSGHLVLPSPIPYLLVWGLLLFPTFLVWSAMLAAVHSLTGSRHLTYGVGLGALVFTLYRGFTDRLDWVGNWLLWDVLAWSDIAPLSLDRGALVLNRLLALALAAFFLALAVYALRRRELDPAQLVGELRATRLLARAKRLAPVALPLVALPLILGGVLWLEVLGGFSGARAQEEAKRYWRQNLETWREAPQPGISRAEVDLRLEPEASRLVTRGSFELTNPHAEALERFAVTGGRHWREVSWSLNGEAHAPEERSGLYVFTPPQPLAPGASLRLGFSFSGRVPDGISEAGGELPEFILPHGVVLTSFRPTFVPVIGFSESRGVDDENRTDPPDYPDDFYLEIVPPSIGSPTLYPVRLRVDAPAGLMVHGVGVLTEDRVEEGRAIRVWETDHPVAFFNVVAGRWAMKKGEGTAVYYHPEHAFNVEAMSQALDASRRHYSRWFAPYPWRELKLSEFPNLATYAQGFATNITFSEGVGFLTLPDAETDAIFMVTAHEAAHQWWGNLLRPGDGPGGAVLSEGMAHLSTLLLFEEEKGAAGRRELAKRLEETYNDRRRPDAERPLVKTDLSQPGDRTVIYDKGGWAFWMLGETMGREPFLAGLRSFLATWSAGPDYPLLEDFLAHLRPFAPDAAAYDEAARQWFHEVALPEYRVTGARVAREGEEWRVTARVENRGSGRFAVEVALSGKEAGADGERLERGSRSRTTLTLGPGESHEISLRTAFEPERLVVDPDVRLLQKRREHAVAEL